MRIKGFRLLLVIAPPAALVIPVIAQVPPPETKAHVIADVGPLPAPSSCGCVTDPFTFMPPRPGWGYGSAPGGPETDAPPSRSDREFQRKRDEETLENLPLSVEQALSGNYGASFGIALDVAAGTALERNEVEATRWFHLSATQGHHQAMGQLAHRYARGIGVEQDDSLAAYWFHRGASHGETWSMVALGGLYAAGRGVPQDWGIAVAWWRTANYHQFVGDAYACGMGVERDDERAAREYKEGADRGNMQSAIQLAHMHAGRCIASPEDAIALKWYEDAANGGYPEAQVGLANLVLQGRGGKARGPLTAYLWARLAELRLPAGELRVAASNYAAEAARRMSPAEIADTEAMVKELIAAGAQPMNR
jgi:TPR repeat protein